MSYNGRFQLFSPVMPFSIDDDVDYDDPACMFYTSPSAAKDLNVKSEILLLFVKISKLILQKCEKFIAKEV